MKKNSYSILFLILFVLSTTISFSQNNGWVCQYGYYGSGPCTIPVTGVCPSFGTVLNACPGITIATCAALNTGVNRITFMDSTCYGNGIDPNSASPNYLHVVPPGGGNYAIRLGDDVTGGTDSANCSGTCNGPGCFARAEGIRLTFNVNAQNALFTYRYSVFLQNGGHLPEEQPRFEILFTRPNAGDSLIPNGYFKIVANNSNPYCPGVSSNFHTNGSWQYSDWTNDTADLTNYIGQDIAVQFRTSDCFPGSGIFTSITGTCTTTIQNGDTCISAPSIAACPDSGLCYGTTVCSNTPGSHSAYAYIDVEGFPLFNGINELHNNVSISIYPNPMTSSSIIEINGEQNNAEVAIYDMVGKVLLRRKLIANKTEIQKGDLAQGVYLVRVNQYIKKLIVE